MLPPTDPNLELVKSMGSKKGYDPMPPDQYLYFLNSPDEVQRTLAWVRSKTIRKGHRSPFCVAENGTRPLRKADLARDCFDGDRSRAQRAWDRAEQMGLVFVNEKGFLCLKGDPPMPVMERNRRTTGESELAVQHTIPSYLVEKIKGLPEDRRGAFEADYATYLKYRASLEADAIAMARIHADRIEDNMYRHYFGDGGKKRMEKKHRPELHETGSELLQLNLLLVPEELATFVQTTEPISTDHKNGIAQTTPELPVISVFRGSEENLSSSSSSSVNGEPSSPAPTGNGTTTTTPDPEFHEQHVAAWEAAGKDGVPTPKQSARAARALGNRQLDFLRWLTPQKLKRVEHPGALPKLVAEFLQTKSSPRLELVPKCWKCGGSLENGSVDGACFNCALASQHMGAAND